MNWQRARAICKRDSRTQRKPKHRLIFWPLPLSPHISDRHPNVEKLNLGLTVFFPFHKSIRGNHCMCQTRKHRGHMCATSKEDCKTIGHVGQYRYPSLCDGASSRFHLYSSHEILSQANRCFDLQCASLDLSVGKVPVQIACHHVV